MTGKANLDNTMAGMPISLTLKGAAEGSNSTTITKALAGESLQISADSGSSWTDVIGTTDDKGQLSITINEPGTYLISNKGNRAHAYYAKAIAVVTVKEDADKTAAQAGIAKIDALPEAAALKIIDEVAVTEAKAAFDALTTTQKALVDDAHQTKLNADVTKMAELKAAEELAQALADAKTVLAGYKDQEDYRAAERTERNGRNHHSGEHRH
ncbi:hypothetical protein [Eubacterium aggregans]|uniref:hypothetical protein n=1 Tax=Eubacterium aggregans TaxID=81409 RepID=UPI003F3FF9DA